MFQAMRQEGGDTVSQRLCIDAETGKCNLRNLNGSTYTESVDASLESRDEQSDCDAHSFGSAGTGQSEGSMNSRSKHQSDENGDILLENALISTLNTVGDAVNLRSDQKIEVKSNLVLYKIFRGDMLSLEITIMMLVSFSQNLLLTEDNQTLVNLILRDALRLIMLSRKSAMNKVHIKKKLYHNQILPFDIYCKNGKESKKAVYTSETSKFYLRDTSIIFPILSALSLQYISGFFSDDDDFTKLKSLESTFIAISGDYGDPVHTIRALSISEWRLSFLNEYERVINCVRKIRNLYDFNSCSSQLVSIYGSDVGILSLAHGVRSALLFGDFSCANEGYAYIR